MSKGRTVRCVMFKKSKRIRDNIKDFFAISVTIKKQERNIGTELQLFVELQAEL